VTGPTRRKATCLASAPGLVGAWDSFDLSPRVLPRALHYPGHRTLKSLRFLLNFLKHRFGEIKTLLALVALRDVRTALVLLVGHG